MANHGQYSPFISLFLYFYYSLIIHEKQDLSRSTDCLAESRVTAKVLLMNEVVKSLKGTPLMTFHHKGLSKHPSVVYSIVQLSRKRNSKQSFIVSHRLNFLHSASLVALVWPQSLANRLSLELSLLFLAQLTAISGGFRAQVRGWQVSAL